MDCMDYYIYLSATERSELSKKGLSYWFGVLKLRIREKS